MNHDDIGDFGFEKKQWLELNQHFGFQKCGNLLRNIVIHAWNVPIIKYRGVGRKECFSLYLRKMYHFKR